MRYAGEILTLDVGTENVYLRAWFDSNGAETKPIGKSSSSGPHVRVC